MARSPEYSDTATRYGLVSIVLHWLIALTYFGLFAVGYYMVTLGYYDPWYTSLPHWHKSIGMLMVLVALASVGWRMLVQKPRNLDTHQPWEILGSKVVHWMLGIGVVVVLGSGYLIPTAEGAGITIFNWFTVPSIIGLARQEDIAGLVHQYVAYGVLAISVLHASAAIKHHVLDRDDTLRRMLPLITRKGDL